MRRISVFVTVIVLMIVLTVGHGMAEEEITLESLAEQLATLIEKSGRYRGPSQLPEYKGRMLDRVSQQHKPGSDGVLFGNIRGRITTTNAAGECSKKRR